MSADEQIEALTEALAEAKWMRDHWERCFNEANDSAADALRALRTRTERGVVCGECGALVYEKTWHREWHRDLEGQR